MSKQDTNPDGTEDYDLDPDCPLKLEVVPHPYGSSSRGMACRGHGGHCRPDEHCDKRRNRAERYGLMFGGPEVREARIQKLIEDAALAEGVFDLDELEEFVKEFNYDY